MRVDQWLHVVRLYKTRTVALEAIRGGHVRVNAASTKPARNLQVDDTVEIRQEGLTRRYRVLGFPLRRVGAAQVPEYATDLTPPEDYEVAKLQRMSVQPRQQGAGRPTKKDRRALEQWRQDSGTRKR